MISDLVFPFDPMLILRKYRKFRRHLIGKENLTEKRVFVASGTTTSEVISILEVFLLNIGIKPIFLIGQYGLYYEDLAFKNSELEEFDPDIIYVHTSYRNLKSLPCASESTSEVSKKLESEWHKLKEIWDNIAETYGCIIIQNNFEMPLVRPLGNLESVHHAGHINFINRLNARMAKHANACEGFYINDINFLSSYYGVRNWFSLTDWHRSKHSVSLKYVPYLAYNLSNIISSIFGKSRKALVLDLDNTLWGGVIGDDGVSNIKIGIDSSIGGVFYEFQKYIKSLQARGILLSVASKNEMDNALLGINHPSGCLKEKDFTVIKANWGEKSENVKEIISELNILDDAVVFVDDNPAERDAVRQVLPEVAVVDLTTDVAEYLDILDRSGLFEPVSISKDDLLRNESFKANRERKHAERRSVSYTDFLISLNMEATIRQSDGEELERISQLVNKTNQFNLTATRYSSSEIYQYMKSASHMVIYGRLEDKFGDNGIVSVMICSMSDVAVEIICWVMSCRVFKRNMEFAMFDVLLKTAKSLNKKVIKGFFVPSNKNKIVEPLYRSLGFKKEDATGHEDNQVRYLLFVDGVPLKNETIRVIDASS